MYALPCVYACLSWPRGHCTQAPRISRDALSGRPFVFADGELTDGSIVDGAGAFTFLTVDGERIVSSEVGGACGLCRRVDEVTSGRDESIVIGIVYTFGG